jgi:uncharacterized membrane protein YebE (DUF533 family)
VNASDRAPLVAIAILAARADGQSQAQEQSTIDAVVAKIGSPDVSRLTEQVMSSQVQLSSITTRLSDDEARQLAYETALAVCHADGALNAAEQRFLDELRQALGLSGPGVENLVTNAAALSTAPAVPAASPLPDEARLDRLILQQAMLTGALEILPDRLANIAVLPLQMRLVYQVGQHYGQKMDGNQVKDLIATLGIGVAAQAMEGVLMKVLGGVAGGLLGGMLGGATRVATGAAVTFASTYALGNVAKQYYAQGRKLSTNDLKSLFARFKDEAGTIYPKVQQEIQAQSQTLNLNRVLAIVHGETSS